MIEESRITLHINTEQMHELSLGQAIPVPVSDYNFLINKPRINGVELQGDTSIESILYDGLIVDGGIAVAEGT